MEETPRLQEGMNLCLPFVRLRDLAAKRPQVVGWGSTLLLAVGGVLLAVGLWVAAWFLVVLGVAVALLALCGLHDLLYLSCGDSPGGVVCLGVGLTGYVLGCGLIVLAVAMGSGAAGLFGALIASAALAAVAAAVRLVSGTQSTDGRVAWMGVVSLTVAGVAFAFISLPLAVLLRETNGWLAVAVLLGVLGVVVAAAGLQAMWSRGRAGRWAIGGMVLIGVAALAVLASTLLEAPVLAIAGALAFLLGLIPVGRAALVVPAWRKPFRYLTLVILGAAVATVLTVTFSRAYWPLSWTLTAIVLSAIVAVALVSNGAELAVMLLVGAALAAVVTDRVDRAPSLESESGWIVALGDSYISGEGAARYLEGTNVAGMNECRRSSTAYPYLVAEKLGYGLDFLACSGAQTQHVDLIGQQSPDSEAAGGRPQLAYLDAQSKDIKAVLVSIGGNDAWFGVIGQACFASGSCDVHDRTVLSHVAVIGDRIERVYQAIRDHVGSHVPIIAMPYPLIATPLGCDSSLLTREEHQFVFQLTEVLNDRARTKAAQVGINWFDEGIEAYKGERICDVASNDAAVNVIDINPPEGSLAERLNPTNWVHGSAHPNARGHELTAELLWPRLERLIDQATSDPATANPEPASDRFRLTLPTRTRIVPTRSLEIPKGLPCPRDELPVIAVASPARLGAHQELNVAPGSPICATEPDGTWAANDTGNAEGQTVVPAWSRDVLEADQSEVQTFQIVVYQDARIGWRVLAGEYCELDPACAEDAAAIEQWTLRQIQESARTAIVPALLIFAGFWFLAVEARREILKRYAAETAETNGPRS